MVSVYAPGSLKLTRLREWRRKRTLTQQQLADKAGLARATLSNIERGQDEPHTSTIRRLADALHVRPEQLMD